MALKSQKAKNACSSSVSVCGLHRKKSSQKSFSCYDESAKIKRFSRRTSHSIRQCLVFSLFHSKGRNAFAQTTFFLERLHHSWNICRKTHRTRMPQYSQRIFTITSFSLIISLTAGSSSTISAPPTRLFSSSTAQTVFCLVSLEKLEPPTLFRRQGDCRGVRVKSQRNLFLDRIDSQ